jgi:uncharacterized membrane protein
MKSDEKPAELSKWSDRRIEEIVGRLLQVGVSLSAAVVLIGGLIYLVRHGFAVADYRTFRGEPLDFRTVRGVFHSADKLEGKGIIQLGLLILIATPVARVAFSIWGFAAERDRMYVTFTVIVLSILLYSLLGSAH